MKNKVLKIGALAGALADRVFFSKFTKPARAEPHPLGHRITKLARLVAILATVLLLGDAAAFGQSPPAASLIYNAMAPIHGGVAAGPGGWLYIATLNTGSANSTVKSISTSGSLRWTFTSPLAGAAGDMHPTPSVDAAGAKVFIGSDAGVLYCLNAATGVQFWQYPALGNYPLAAPIRSSATLDPNSPLGSTVYFQGNDQNLYALNAATGVLRWQFLTGNQAPTSVSCDETPTPGLSSSPVVGSDGTVYVATAAGDVWAIDPSTGGSKWPGAVGLGKQVAASLAIGLNGWLYAASSGVGGGTVFAIDPAVAMQNPTAELPWFRALADLPGFVASPVIDQSGFIYVASSCDETVFKLDPLTGATIASWIVDGAICQTPSINQDGLLILGTAQLLDGDQDADPLSILAFNTASQSMAPLWSITSIGGNTLAGNFVGASTIDCGTGYTYLADDSGKVFRLLTGSPLMAGMWPTFQSGGRRAGKAISYSTVIAPLPAFIGDGSGYAGFTDVSGLDAFGRACGQSYGYYNYGNGGGSGLGFAAAFWDNNSVRTPGAPTPAAANNYATSISAAGDIVGYQNGTGTLPIIWPGGAFQGASPINLSIFAPSFSSGVAMRSTFAQNRNVIGYAWNSTTTEVLGWNTSDGGLTWIAFDLGTTAGNAAYAYAMTDNLRIAGKAKFSVGGQFHALVTDVHAPGVGLPGDDKGTFDGGSVESSEAWDVRDESGSVGWSKNSSGYTRAFYLPVAAAALAPGQLPPVGSGNELPHLPGVTTTKYNSAAYGVNRFGQVVGYAQDNSGASRAFLYTPGPSGQAGTMTNLNTRLPGGSLWVLTSARAINDAGIIVGTGTYNGASGRAWIFYPTCQE